MENQNKLFEEEEPKINFSEIAPTSFTVEITDNPEEATEQAQEPAQEQPKRGPGRPPKNNGIHNPPPATFSSLGQTEQQRPTGQTVGTTLAKMFPSEGLIMILDKVMSNLVPIALNNLVNTRLKPKDFVLTTDEIDTISPLLDAAAETVPINLGNPWANLGIVLLGTYTAKAAGAMNFDFEDRPVMVTKSKGRGRPRKNG